MLHGPIGDEAALHGILIKVRDLALPLLAVSRVPESKKKATSDSYLYRHLPVAGRLVPGRAW